MITVSSEIVSLYLENKNNSSMKKFFMILALSVSVCCIGPVSLVAQNVSISNTGPSAEASTILDMKSTDKGILLPRLTASQRNAIANPVKGLLVFQMDGTAGFYYYDGHSWISLIDGNVVTTEGVSEGYGLVTRFAGSSFGYANGIDTAKFKSPSGIAIDRIGNLYVADRDNHAIRMVTPLAVVTLVAGSTSPDHIDGSAANAAFNKPTGITVGADGNLYIADTDNNVIRKVTRGGVTTTFAGDGLPGYQDGNGNSASFSHPLGIASDAAGNLYVADVNNQRIRKITPAAEVTTIAGNGIPAFVNGIGTAASFDGPVGVTVDAAGNIYVADRDNHCIRKITAAGVVSTFAGTGASGATDGTVATATFHSPRNLAIDPEGNFYIADAGNHMIRKITPGGIVSTLAGAGVPGNAEGQTVAAYFNDPTGLVTDNMGNLYVTDTGNNIIRKIIIH
jgi:sugar lactone lactonase YvrE